MTEDIKSLVDALRRGDYEDPTAKIEQLVAALREQGGADAALLLSLLEAPQIPIRMAAVEACQRRAEPEVQRKLAAMANDVDSRVRYKLAETLGTLTGKASEVALRALVQDEDSEVRRAALKSTGGKPAFREAQQASLAGDRDWQVRLAAAEAPGGQNTPVVAGELLRALAREGDSDIQGRCADLLEKRLASARAVTDQHLPTEIAVLERAERAVKEMGAQRFPQLCEWLQSKTSLAANPEELAAFGLDLTALAGTDKLPRTHGFDEHCQQVLKLLAGEKPRSVVLLGESGCGKTALVNELTRRLALPGHGGWRVLRMLPTDFLVGTQYIGEWETRLKKLVEAIRRPRRVVLYVPDLAHLSNVGKHDKSDANVATALAPYLSEGALVILGESTPAEFNRGLGRNPELQRLFDRYLLPEASTEDTRTILRSFRDEAGAGVSDEMLDRVLELATHYLGSQARPGNAVGLLKQVLATHGTSAIETRHLLETLSKSTGVPADLLDDAVPLEAVAARRFFEARVMGQPEAAEAVVDVVTLIKAGLTDPHKPFGVFLFVGPTGVGKTELARALAEFIFGDAKRLVRLDMSEFASMEGFERLLGTPGRPGLLTEPVRVQPFSVVLLDEIEKSHVNVFDLCLQLFDAGRLTDGQGRTVDFRRTIVILTSNVGASVPQMVPLGFGQRTELAVAEPDREKTLRELNRCFRPEFLNRLDRIVNFRPLSLEVAHEIARKEVALVLGRSGIARRRLTVDVDESVLALLVKEGYSPHFGARPLKRAVEKHVLLPLGRIIAAGRIEEGRVLRLTQVDDRLEVVPVQEPAKAVTVTAATPTSPSDLTERAEGLLQQCAALEEASRPLADRKSELLSQTAQAGFYDDARRRTEVFDEVHRLDQFLGQCGNLRQAIEGLRNRLNTKNLRQLDRMHLEAKCETLEVELSQLGAVAKSRNALELGDALLHLELVSRTGNAVEAIQALVKMYQAFATRRRLEVEVLAERWEGQKDEVYLLCAGLGAFGCLRGETGFHQFDRRYREHTQRGGREKQREDRELVKVRVFPAAGEPERRFVSALTKRVSSLPSGRGRFVRKAGWEVSLMDPESMVAVSGWLAGKKEVAVERLARCLFWSTAPGGQVKATDLSGVLRQYELGIAPRVKDARSGRSTNRIERVLQGQLELVTGAEGSRDGDADGV